MFPTPNLSHLTTEIYREVYEPAEDTFLLLDALESECDNLNALSPSVCVEIGSGSGVCITFLGKLVGSKALYLCTDINPNAVAASKATADVNGVLLEPVLTDLAASLKHRLYKQIDVLIFNPPYVVTPTEEEPLTPSSLPADILVFASELTPTWDSIFVGFLFHLDKDVGSHGIAASWAGGSRGREVMDRLFPQIPHLLSDKGVFFLVIVKENDQDEIEDILDQYGLQMRVILSRRSGPEFLSILKFSWKKS